MMTASARKNRQTASFGSPGESACGAPPTRRALAFAALAQGRAEASLWALLAALALGGCAIGRAERRLDQDLAQAPSPATPAQVRQEVDRAIAEAPNLTDPQRAQLRALRGRSCETLDNLQRQRLALEAALIKELVAPSFDAKEAAAVERRMRDLDSARLSLLFDAVAKANAILGREASRHEKLIQALMRENRYSSASDPLLNR